MLTNLRQFFAGFRPENCLARAQLAHLCVSSLLCILRRKSVEEKEKKTKSKRKKRTKIAVSETMRDRDCLTNNNLRRYAYGKTRTKSASCALYYVLSYVQSLTSLERINVSPWTSHEIDLNKSHTRTAALCVVKMFGSSYRLDLSRSGTPTARGNSDEIQFAVIPGSRQPSRAFRKMMKVTVMQRG